MKIFSLAFKIKMCIALIWRRNTFEKNVIQKVHVNGKLLQPLRQKCINNL